MPETGRPGGTTVPRPAARTGLIHSALGASVAGALPFLPSFRVRGHLYHSLNQRDKEASGCESAECGMRSAE
jgi:hypothetical protein